MKIYEKYKEQLDDLDFEDDCRLINRRTINNNCEEIECETCQLFNLTSFIKWMNEEYETPIELSYLEYEILDFLYRNNKASFIVRNSNGKLYLFQYKPKKVEHVNEWQDFNAGKHLENFDELFQFIKWSDEKPYSIKGILKRCKIEVI
jgi:hypothetical protein